MELALSTVAKWAGSAIIKKLVEMAYSHLGKCMLPADIEFKAQLSRLETALPQMAAVMGVGEVLKFKYPNSGVNEWLEKFKEAFLAAEDVLDELKYRELEDEVKNRDQVSGSSSSTVKKKIYSLQKKITGFSLKKEKKPSGSSNGKDILNMLRGAVENLDRVTAGVGHFFQFTNALDFHGLARPNNQPINTFNRETTSLLTESKVVGREAEKDMIIEWLMKPASHGNISAFCIVGVGGLGKTTLAQLIFEEISRENHFDEKIWVCVSTSFSVKDITRNILQELGENGHHNESLNGLQKSLKERIISKKIFLILDDVWNDDKVCDWETLIAPLKFVQQGSKILLTTRMKSVANILALVLNLKRENLVLEGLKEQELLELLNKYAFSGYNPDNHKDLQEIRNDIVKKLRGSPLAAKVIGSLLNSYMDIHYWKQILSYDSLINLEKAKDVADVLKLSYYHLPAHLQECFRFCCIFPQDYEFDKDKLIRMWVATGFIHQDLHGEEKPEDIGKEYFNQLVRKSFFEQRSPFYVMHDLMHDLAQNVSEGECCRVELNGKSDNIPRTAQHVHVPGSKIERIFNLRNIRTLVITLSDEDYGNQELFVLPNGSLKKTLRLLVIKGHGRCALPEEIGSLLHLRLLSVDPPRMGQSYRCLLRNSIYKLYHLQVLDMPDSHYLHDKDVETTGMTNLVSLRYIVLPKDVMQIIHGVHKLTSLQALKFYVGRESGHHIDELEMLNNLKYLYIEQIENVGVPVEAMNANLSKKENLISLYLEWTNPSNSDDSEQVIDNLRPNPNLKDLSIVNYTGRRSPSWMRDSSHLYLSSLTLRKCHFWETLPFVEQMPYLKELSLSHMEELKEVNYSCNAFPSLEHLHCLNMPKWESWVGPQICYGFSNLKQLSITNCRNLAKLPSIPISLFSFKVETVGLNSLPDIHHGSSITAPAPSCMKSSLREVVITHCPKLISLDGFLQQQNLDLQAIQNLIIECCKNLLHIPEEGFAKLTSLKELTIINIPELVGEDFQSNLIPVKLQKLTMGNCGKLDVPLFEASFGLTNLTNLVILRSATITSNTFPENTFTSLKFLYINDCPNLTKLPYLPLSLNELTIDKVAVSDLPEYSQSSHSSDPTSSALTTSLRDVKISSCSNLTSLNGFLQQENIDLSGLETLEIEDCENLVKIPTEVFGKFVSLKSLVIKGCPKLVELSSVQQAHTVNPVYNLVSLKISSLKIDHLSLLLIDPLRCLRFVSILSVQKCSGMEALPEQWLLQNSSSLKQLRIFDASSLRSLPGTMVILTSLERLLLFKATSLEKIPELPTSLIDKGIYCGSYPWA